MTWRGSKLLKHLIQFLCMMMAWGTALSRVSDYKHHWSDVLAGAIQGAVVALVVVRILLLFTFIYFFTVERVSIPFFIKTICS